MADLLRAPEGTFANETSARLDAFLVDDALNCLVIHKATTEQLIDRGDQMALAMRDARDEIERLQALVDNNQPVGEATRQTCRSPRHHQRNEPMTGHTIRPVDRAADKLVSSARLRAGLLTACILGTWRFAKRNSEWPAAFFALMAGAYGILVGWRACQVDAWRNGDRMYEDPQEAQA